MAEAAVSNTVQCGFESFRVYFSNFFKRCFFNYVLFSVGVFLWS